jgi:seryl-tRNA synthetase
MTATMATPMSGVPEHQGPLTRRGADGKTQGRTPPPETSQETPMLDRKRIAKNPEAVRQALARRGESTAAEIDRVLEVDARWKQHKARFDELKHGLKEAGKGFKGLDPKSEEAAALRARLAETKEEVQRTEQQLKELEAERDALLMGLPNEPDPQTPDGASEADNVEVERWGDPPALGFTPQPHWEIGERLGLLDFERAARMSGARFAVLRGMGARLEWALARLMLDRARDRGYLEVIPPYLVRRPAMEASGQLPKFEQDAFRTAGEHEYFLIPTAEVPLVNLHREEIIEPQQLPLSYTALTPCFRAEAGSYGKDVRGLIRQHQFHKVELVKLTTPETSAEQLQTLRADAEAVLRELELPYRTAQLCAGDLGFSAAVTYDLEVWLPGQQTYREISSCSNCGDFQARRAQIRYRAGKKDNRYVHTLNGSALAVGRTLLALLENHQHADGSVGIPAALRPYLDGLEEIPVP